MEYTVDTDVPENIGIYALRACREEYKEQYFTYWEDMQIAGIYVPDKSWCWLDSMKTDISNNKIWA